MKKENNIKLHARMVYSPPSPAHNHRSPTKQIEKLAHFAEFTFLSIATKINQTKNINEKRE